MQTVLQGKIEGHFVENIYPVVIDYDKKIEVFAKTFVNRGGHLVTTEMFPPNLKKGRHEVLIKLRHFDRGVISSEVIQELYQTGFRPADIYELLAFGEKHYESIPAFVEESVDYNHRLKVIALGSVNKESCAIGLCKDGQESGKLYTRYVGKDEYKMAGHFSNTRFAVVELRPII